MGAPNNLVTPLFTLDNKPGVALDEAQEKVQVR